MAVKATHEVTIVDNTDIDSLVTWYYLTTSATKPAAPTTTQTSAAVPSPWTQNEPTFTAGTVTNYLYTVLQTQWKDGSCSWGGVQLSSSYEQAKQAWNKAAAAQATGEQALANVGLIEAPYTEVEWVESDGTQFVYLDWKPPMATWGFEADFIIRNAFTTTSNGWNPATNASNGGFLLGTQNSSQNNDIQIGAYGSTGYCRIGGTAGGSASTYNAKWKTDKSRQTIKLHGTTLTCADGSTVTVTRATEVANKPYANMCVFCYHSGVRRSGTGNLVWPSSSRIYSLKFYDGNTLECDLVGAIRNRDGMTGLYDKVKGHFYPARDLLCGDEVGSLGEPESVVESMARMHPIVHIDNRSNARMLRANVPELTDLADGQQLTVTFSTNIGNSTQTTELAGWDDTTSNGNVYLKLTLAGGKETEWIPCYYAQGTRLTSHYGSGTPVLMTYREDVHYGETATSAGTLVMRGWWADPNYNTDDPYTRYSDTVIAGLNGVKRYSLNMRDANGNWTSIMNQDNNVAATGKTAYTGGLMLGNVLYHNSSANIAAGGNTGQMKESHGGVDFRHDVNGITNAASSTELQLRKPVYLVGTVGSDGLFYLDTTKWWTQTEPTSADGKVYVLIGSAYNSYYAIFLAVDNPAYVFHDGEWKLYDKYMADEASKVAGNYIVETSTNDVWIHSEGHGPNSQGAATSNTYGWRIGSVFELVRAGLSYLKMWVDNSVAKVRVGLETAGHSIFSPDGMEVFTDSTTNVAKFGSTARIGKASGASRMELDYRSMQLVDKEGDTYFHVGDLRDEDGSLDVSDWWLADGERCDFFLSNTANSTGYTVKVDGTTVTSGILKTQYLIRFSTAPSSGATVTAQYTTEDQSAKSLTFGTRANGRNVGGGSVAIGDYCAAIGRRSVAVGSRTIADGNGALAFGNNSRASGQFSAAMGEDAVVNGSYALAAGRGAIAASAYQTVMGTYNDNQPAHAFEVGNGTANDARSNAFAVGWNGDVECGDVNGVEISDSGWNTLTLASGWVAYETAQAPKYRKIGSLVELCGAVKPTAATTLDDNAVAFGTLPAGYRPNSNRHQLCQASGTRSWLLTVYPNGNAGAARLRAQNSTSYQSAATTEWLTFHIMYFVD